MENIIKKWKNRNKKINGKTLAFTPSTSQAVEAILSESETEMFELHRTTISSNKESLQ